MAQNYKCLMQYTKPYVSQETSAEYLLYPMLIPLNLDLENKKSLNIYLGINNLLV